MPSGSIRWVAQPSPSESFDVVFDPATVRRAQSWSPGVALPLTFVLAIAGMWVEPGLWWLAVGYVVLSSVLWLWWPFNFWVLGAAPLIELSPSHVRVTSRGKVRVEALEDFLLVEFHPGVRWVCTKDDTFASIQFLWKPGSAPGVDGFVKEERWFVELPLRSRDRRSILMRVALDCSAHGLSCEFADTNPPERVPAST
mgnify:CR=1 FL=1